LFVIRTAGHVLSKESIGSIEYGVNSAGANLVIVLGHDDCGAVKAAMSFYKSEKQRELSENLSSVLNFIYPVVDNCKPSDSIDDVVVSNIHYQVEELKKDKNLLGKLENKELMIIGAKYNLKTGMVDFYED